MNRDLSKLTSRRGGTAGKRNTAGLTSRKKYTPEPDPLRGVEYTGDLAADAAAEMTALEQGYRDRAKAENDRFKRATDTEYWVAVCFTSREEKDAFLKAAGLAHLGDKYLAGPDVAAALDISLD